MSVARGVRLAEVVAVLERIAPTRHAENWDNVGLLVGDPEQTIRSAILTIDLTREVMAEARHMGCELVVAYHPPIFNGLKRMIAGGPVFDALRHGIAIHSPHTALDVAEGGTNDVLADAIGISRQSRTAIRFVETKASQHKLVTFVPEADADRVADALFEAGAGRIGDYTQCSFRSPGTGTFFGGEGTNPAIGSAGKLERAAELRVETVVPVARLHAVLEALRRTHPYEEPAFDLIQLAAPPEKLGQGRIGPVGKSSRREIVDRIRRALGLTHVLVAGPCGNDDQVERAACCAGSGGELLDEAVAQGAQLFVTGELRHHDVLRAAERGVTVVCTLHSNSERAALEPLAARMRTELPALEVIVSSSDRDPFMIH